MVASEPRKRLREAQCPQKGLCGDAIRPARAGARGGPGRAHPMSRLLEMRAVTRRFGGVQALSGVDFDLAGGEVHALLGENGAGKSTLMNILCGVLPADGGTIRVDGQETIFASPRRAQEAGIAMIHQELDLIAGLDISANLFLGHERSGALGLLDRGAMRERARERLAAAGIALDPDRRIADLRIGERQLVAIAKALSAQARILVMDEPTAALSPAEAGHLFGVVRGLAARGVGIVYISHRLEEVARVADRVTVLRDGRVAGEAPADAPQAELVRLLVGRPFEELFPPRATRIGPELLALEQARYLCRTERAGWRAPRDITLCVHEGEIVGLAGLMGAGRTELLSALFGAAPRGRWRGEMRIGGRPARLGTIAAARANGLAFVTDDRRGSGLVLGHSVGWNVVMAALPRFTPWGLAAGAAERRAVMAALESFDIRPRRAGLVVRNLSGGNQQKVVFAKESLTAPRLLLLDEPTRGVDVGAKSEIYHRLRGLAGAGLGVLVASSEMPELVGLCDRIVVMRDGATVAEFPGGAGEAVLQRASGGEGGMSDGTAAVPAASRVRPIAWLLRFQSLIGLVLVLLGGIVFSPRRHGQILFLSPDNIGNIIRSISETGIIALGMTFVIIAAGIDLSVGAILGLSSVLTASLMINYGWAVLPTLAVVLIAGTVFGTLQGLIITRFRLQAFIVTLAGLQAARGLALVASHNNFINISYGHGPGLAPPAFGVLGDRMLGNVFPVAALVFLALAVVAAVLLDGTRFGRYVFAVGGNERAARLSGIPVARVRVAVFAITGFASAIAGIVHAGQFSFGSPNDGAGYELTAIAAVVIGGTDLFGGAGSMLGTIAGSIMLGALANILQLNDVSAAMQLLATGAIIVAAAALQTYVGRRDGEALR